MVHRCGQGVDGGLDLGGIRGDGEFAVVVGGDRQPAGGGRGIDGNGALLADVETHRREHGVRTVGGRLRRLGGGCGGHRDGIGGDDRVECAGRESRAEAGSDGIHVDTGAVDGGRDGELAVGEHHRRGRGIGIRGGEGVAKDDGRRGGIERDVGLDRVAEPLRKVPERSLREGAGCQGGGIDGRAELRTGERGATGAEGDGGLRESLRDRVGGGAFGHEPDGNTGDRGSRRDEHQGCRGGSAGDDERRNTDPQPEAALLGCGGVGGRPLDGGDIAGGGSCHDTVRLCRR